MSNKIKSEMDKIVIPEGLHERSKLGIQQAKAEMNSKKSYPLKSFALVAGLVLLIGSYTMYNQLNEVDMPQTAQSNDSAPVVKEGESIQIPAISLPKENGAKMDMIGLIVYQGKIYTQTATKMDASSAQKLLGEKLGRTKNTIDEWSEQDEYAVEFASTVGETDVYSVQGYDKAFRIITYQKINGETYSEIYENLNGITIQKGEDLFEYLNMTGNIESVQYRHFDDWNNGIESYHPFEDTETVELFAAALNETKPYTGEYVETELGDFRNNGQYKELILHLTDGSQISLVVLKEGYIRYGYLNVYFKMDDEVFAKVWELLN
ncbi:hypothetical protein LCL95_09635 [Bacillus timonensis]|nr:hypothetical protein [Bacillus timonensis]